MSLLVERRTPYPAAYARFRLAEALLADRARRDDATAELRVAHATAVTLGARPLRERVEGLAIRARLAIATSATEAAATDETDGSAVDPLAAYDLTTREVEVLKLVAAGRTNRQIAEELFISESTAGVHVSHIIGKLAVSGRVEAATIAARLGLVD